MRPSQWSGIALAVMVVAGCGAATSVLDRAAADTIYKFCSTGRPHHGCRDGKGPTELAVDAAGNLFGTTTDGGALGFGAVYELVPNADKSAWTYVRLYSFCPEYDCSGGSHPNGGVIVDVDGNVYGTTIYGGASNNGSVFELTPNARRTKWTFHLLYSFCTQANCSDGYQPQAALTYAGASSGAAYDGVSPLYGITHAGGLHGLGTVYELDRSDGQFIHSVLYNFCPKKSCVDGYYPATRLTVAANGDLFGTTEFGGNLSKSAGAVFRLHRNGKGVWHENVLHAFCSELHCADGHQPSSGVLIDAAGNLFGVTGYGGNADFGLLYRIAADGTFQPVWSFCQSEACTDGKVPSGDLSLGSDGSLFGTTAFGGAGDSGTVFALKGAAYSVLQSFCLQESCGDGAYSETGIVMDKDGDLFGTTDRGGWVDGGVVFRVTR